MYSTPYSSQILIKPEFFQHIFEKSSIVKNCMEFRPVGARSFHADRQTDKYEAPSIHFLQFCERT